MGVEFASVVKAQATLRFRWVSPEEVCADLSTIDKPTGMVVERNRSRLKKALQSAYHDRAGIVDDATKQEIADILCELDKAPPVEMGERIHALDLDHNKLLSGGPRNSLKKLDDACEYGDAARAQIPEEFADRRPGMMYNKLDMESNGQPTKVQSSFPFEEADEKREHWEALMHIIRFCKDQDLLIETLESEGLATRDSLLAEYHATCFTPDSGGRSIAVKTFEQFLDTERTYFVRVVEYLIRGDARTVQEAIARKRAASSERLNSIIESLRGKPR
jgi:hypothetical protein